LEMGFIILLMNKMTSYCRNPWGKKLKIKIYITQV